MARPTLQKNKLSCQIIFYTLDSLGTVYWISHVIYIAFVNGIVYQAKLLLVTGTDGDIYFI